jgi:Mn2+/Fe2+ NRAMP family transporter
MATSTLPAGFWRSFGPGLLWAAAAIGVSHLVQSTRAGATAGLGLAGVVLLALVLKYPFFEYGPRYAAATGSSLVEGYRRIGRWALWLYLLITLATAVIVQTAVVVFTAFLLNFVLGVSWPLPVTVALVVVGCAVLLALGRFRVLDGSVKVILVALALSTLVAAAVTLPRVDWSTLSVWPGIGVDPVPFAFLLALMGWMPSAIDISVWSSLWTLAKDETTGTRTSVASARLDFLIGYAGTGVLAFAFLVLGAGVMYGAGEAFSAQGTIFSAQLIDLYGTTLGAWLRPVVIVAVLATMVSTSLTVVDGFPRAIERSVLCLRSAERPARQGGTVYWVSIGVVGVATVVVVMALVSGLTTMVDFATIVSFTTAPVLGWLNFRAVTGPEVAPEHRPSVPMRVLSWTGLVLLGGTAVVYLGYLLT